MNLILPESLKSRSVGIPYPLEDLCGRRIESGAERAEPELEWVEPAGAPAGSSTIYDFREYAQYQVFSLWCWNAVGAAIAEFHLRGGAGESVLQCRNAERILSVAGCCELSLDGENRLRALVPYIGGENSRSLNYSVGPELGNISGKPQQVTNQTGKFLLAEEDVYHSSVPTAAQLLKVIRRIHDGLPVVMHLTYPGGGGSHVQTIYGTRTYDGVRYFDVADPITGFEVIEEPQRDAIWSGSIFLVPQGFESAGGGVLG